MSWLLDADILSQPAKRHGDARVIAWLEQEKPRCYTSAVVIAQLAFWVRSKEGRQRQALHNLVHSIDWRTARADSQLHVASVAHVWAEQEWALLEQPVSACRSKTATLPRLPAVTI